MVVRWEYTQARVVGTGVGIPASRAYDEPLPRLLGPSEHALELWQQKLDELGSQGWELVTERVGADWEFRTLKSVTYEGTFKRPRETDVSAT
jgi:hypothetical protein